MQTRSPEDLNPAVDPQMIWEVDGDGKAHLIAAPYEEAEPGQAFREDPKGGVEISVGLEITNEDVWEEDPAGGIRLSM